MYAAVCQTCSKEAHPVTILSHSRHTLGYRIIIAKVLGTQVCNPPKFSKCTITTFIHPIKPLFAVIGCIDTVDKGKTWWHSASNGLFRQAIFAVVPQNKSRLDCQWIDSQSCSHLRQCCHDIKHNTSRNTKGKHFRGQEMMMCAKHQRALLISRILRIAFTQTAQKCLNEIWFFFVL